MGLGIPSITSAIQGSPLSISKSLPEQMGEVIDSPTEEFPGAPFDAPLPDAPGVTVPSMPQTPDLLPLPDDGLMKPPTSITSAVTQAAMAAASEDGPVDPYALTDRPDKHKAAYERVEGLAGLAPAPIQDATGSLPVRRQAPDATDLYSRLMELVEGGQLDYPFDMPKLKGACFVVPLSVPLMPHSRYSANA